MKILICGLPGSGKTWLAERLITHLKNCAWYNADFVRKYANDWDFEIEGRIRQAKRMKAFADFEKDNHRFVVCDFVCPTKITRKEFNADYVIWMDTISEGRYEDTNNLFEEPVKVNWRVTEWNDENHNNIAEDILKNV